MPYLFCIFTKISNSLNQNSRHWRSRYTIHAGRNLTVKEFRYLRTVRVTAAACMRLYLMHYISFSLKRAGQMSDLILHFTILQSLVFLINSRYSRFHVLVIIKVFLNYIIKSSFSLSYRVNLSSSLNFVISSTLVAFYLFTFVRFSTVFKLHFIIFKFKY